jgi:putative Mg2+ transporter-C (MgtC) family protein
LQQLNLPVIQATGFAAPAGEHAMTAQALEFGDILLRLAAAGASGCLVGLNRNLHHQGAGLRTYGLVSLSTAGLTIGILLTGGDAEALSRVIQGIMAGVGFLGGGVILRRTDVGRITGLTSAAAVWFVAGLSVLCGLGLWPLTGALLAIALLILMFGRTVERFAERLLGADPEDDEAHEPR